MIRKPWAFIGFLILNQVPTLAASRVVGGYEWIDIAFPYKPMILEVSLSWDLTICRWCSMRTWGLMGLSTYNL